jgi:serine/threonine-protein kinase RsbW
MQRLTILPDEPPQAGECLFSRSYPTRLERKQDIIDELSQVIFTHGLVVEEDRHWLQLCLDEAVVNAMLHGNEGDPALSITIAIHRDQGRWGMMVSDEGCGFDSSSVPDCEDPESLLLEHGRGIHIMKSWFENLTYYRNGSCALMWRTIPPTRN